MKITNRCNQLYRMKKSELKEVVLRSYRVIDLREADKHVMVGLVLEAEFGLGYFQKMQQEKGVRS